MGPLGVSRLTWPSLEPGSKSQGASISFLAPMKMVIAAQEVTMVRIMRLLVRPPDQYPAPRAPAPGTCCRAAA